MKVRFRAIGAAAVALAALGATPAQATPVCTDGYAGGPPLELCGGRIFPEAELARGYVQYTPDPAGFREYQDGIDYLAQRYERWVSVTTLAELYGEDAKSAGADKIRSYLPEDTGDGRDIQIIKITDNTVPDQGKKPLVFSLSVHGPERGGLEGGLRTAEDLAIAATEGGTIDDGRPNYESATGVEPAFHSYEVRDVLAKEVVYLVNFNPDGWAVGDIWNTPPLPYARGNSIGTDLNRQMPTIGRINPSRNPLQESETRFGWQWMKDVAAQGEGGKMAHATDVHGELTSQAYVDIMYPAGQFDSVDHRRLMAIAERTKSVIDETLYDGIIDQIESETGGNEGEPGGEIPTKPAHWATVWDTLGYTDTGFIGDYMATDLAVTGMDYEFFLNHMVPDKVWNVYLQENHINGTRALIKTAMAYALYQEQEFDPASFKVDPKGRPGYVYNPDTVTDTDENGPGRLPGPEGDGIGADGQPVEQRPYDVTNMRFFEEEGRLLTKPFVPVAAGDVTDSKTLDALDTLVLADVALPQDTQGRAIDRAAYYGAIKDWVQRGGNLVLTDRALHALAEMGVVGADAVTDIRVYQPYADIADFEHPLTQGLRANARQLVEAAILGYGIGDDASPMTVVSTEAWEAAGGTTVATTAADTQASIGELPLGAGKIRIVGGALPTPSEEEDHRYGLRDYGLTYSGLYVMENAIEHDAPGLGEGPVPGGGQVNNPGNGAGAGAGAGAAAGPGARKRKCISRRRIALRLKKGTRRKGTRVTVNGRRMKVRRRSGRLVALIDARGMKGRKLTVRIVRRTKSGRRVVQVRRLKLCTPRGR